MWPRKYKLYPNQNKGKEKENHRIFVNVGDDDDPRERRNNPKIYFFFLIYSLLCVSVWCVTHNRKTRVAQRSMVVQRQWSSYRLTAFWTRCFRLLFLYNRVHHPDILSSFDQKKERERDMSNIGCVLYKNILPSKRNFRCLLLFTSCFHVPPTPDLIWWKETLGFALFPWFSILIEILFFYFFSHFL